VTRLATVLLLVILTSVAGLIAPRPASACSCAQLDPAAALAEYPAAFVGTLVEIDGQIGAMFDSEDDTIYRFQVEEWVKGDLGEIVEIHSAANGASCGIEVGVGNRAGLFVQERGGEFTSSLCETLDADVLLAGSEPLEMGAPGPGVVLVAGNIGGYDYVVLNRSGGLVAAINGPPSEPFDQAWQFSLCPGGKTLVEQWSRALVVRDLTDLSLVRQVDLGEYADTTGFTAVRCVAEDGSKVLMAGEEWSGEQATARVFEVAGDITTLVEIPSGQAYLGPDFAVIQSHESGSVSIFDFPSGKTTVAHEVAPSGSQNNYAGVASIAVSPDGNTIAVLETRYEGSDGTSQSSVTTYSRAGERIGSADFEGEGWMVQWPEIDRIVVNRSTQGFASSALLFGAATLQPLSELEDWNGAVIAIAEDVGYSFDGGTFVMADLESGSTETLATLPTQFVGPIAALPTGFEISPDLVAATGEATPVTTPPLFLSSSSQDAEVTSVARAVVVALLVGMVVWAGFLAVRRRREPEADAPDQS
jgi:hypothetical protein